MRVLLKAGIAVLLMAFAGRGVLAQDMVQVRGSDTMVNLVQRLAEVYMQKNPGKYVAVTGGGSGNGLASLRNKTVDIANSSRDVRQREIIDMNGKGVYPVRIVVGKDCMTIVVHPQNEVNQLTISQLGAIFRGEIVNWSEVGGIDGPITLYGRQSNSGTYVSFREIVLEGDYSDNMNRMNGTSQIIEAVKSDPSGIGYVGLGYVKNSSAVKVVGVAEKEGEEYIFPTNREDVDEGKYPLIRTINQYVNGTPAGAIRDFILYELSAEGQQIVDEMGFIPVPEEYAKENSKTLEL
jgi:phosphate transport system substrate-binding protein